MKTSIPPQVILILTESLLGILTGIGFLILSMGLLAIFSPIPPIGIAILLGLGIFTIGSGLIGVGFAVLYIHQVFKTQEKHNLSNKEVHIKFLQQKENKEISSVPITVNVPRDTYIRETGKWGVSENTLLRATKEKLLSMGYKNTNNLFFRQGKYTGNKIQSNTPHPHIKKNYENIVTQRIP